MSKKLDVLFIDDTEDDVLLMLRELEHGGYQVNYTRAQNAEEMAQALENRNPDAIICDYVMPRFSVVEAMGIIKGRDLDIPLIIVSGIVDEEVAISALKSGAHDFINKKKLARLVTSIEREMNEAVIRKERREALRQIHHLNQLYCLLSQTNQTIVRNTDRKTLFEEICRIAIDKGKFQTAWIGMCDPAAFRIHVEACCGIDIDLFKESTISLKEMPLQCELKTKVIEKGTYLTCNEKNRLVCGASCGVTSMITEANNNFKSCAAFPIKSNTRTIGVYAVYSSEEKFFGHDEMNLLTEIAGDISFALKSMEKEELNISALNSLRHERNLIKKIMEASPAGIVMLDADGSIVFANGGAQNILRLYKDDEPQTGRAAEKAEFSESTSGEHAAKILCFQNVKKTLEPVVGFSQTLYRPDGNKLILNINTIPLLDENNKFEGVVSIIDDITESKKMEQMLIQTERMASIGTLAAGIAHEINNPIGYIYSNMKTLQKYSGQLSAFYSSIQSMIDKPDKAGNGKGSSMYQEFKDIREKSKVEFLIEDMGSAINESLEGTERVKRLVADLKDFSRQEKFEMKLSNINEGMEKTLTVIWNELKYKTTVIKKYGNIPDINCDMHRLSQVFMNILINAAQAIDKLGTITITTSCTEKNVIIRISDTGAGIPKSDMSKIYNAFYTTKDPGKGTGLGLSIAYKIIQDHHGFISCDSIVGEGTTFSVVLPRTDYKEVKTYKLLIVDDEPAFLKMMQRVITDLDPTVSVAIAADGFEASEKVYKFNPDIVLLDIMMDGLNGLDVCRKIKNDKNTMHIKVIMMTGMRDEAMRKQSLEAGADGYLQKLESPKEMLAAINKTRYA